MSTMIQQRQRIYEIAEAMEKGGIITVELMKAFARKWDCSERTVYRLYDKAKKLMAEKLLNREVALMAIKSGIEAPAFASDLRSSLELEAELCKLASCPEVEMHDKLKAINIVLKMRNEI